jgi:diacylglycerol kinase family enzyme
MLKQLCLILLGRFDAATHLQAFTTKEITIRTHKKRMHVSRDGEVDTLHSPLHYSIRPKSLRVIAPAASNQA